MQNIIVPTVTPENIKYSSLEWGLQNKLDKNKFVKKNKLRPSKF